MKDEKEKRISKNAKIADNISQEFTEETRLAVESMRRAIKKRKMNVVTPPQCEYRQIF